MIFATSIVLIVTVIGLPSFYVIQQNHLLIEQVNRFVAHVQLARSQAVRNNQVTSICSRGNGLTCERERIKQKIYEAGWLVYLDTDENNDYNSTQDKLITTAGAVTHGVTIRSENNHGSRLNFNPTGMLNEIGSIQVIFCGKDGSTETVPGRMVKINPAGYTSVKKQAAGDSCVL